MSKNERERQSTSKASNSWWRGHSSRRGFIWGAGVLALIVIVAGVIAYRRFQRPNLNSSGNSVVNSNNSGDVRLSANSSTESTQFVYDDEKHRLFQAAGVTQDVPLVKYVLRKIGFVKPDGTVAEDYQKFVAEHLAWAKKNQQFVDSVKTPKNARAFVKEHLKGIY
jgi:hypothetical protein